MLVHPTQICKLCHQDQSKAPGCLVTRIVIRQQGFQRLPFEPVDDPKHPPAIIVRCLNCFCDPNTLHHADCHSEKCPRCYGKLRGLGGCDCQDELDRRESEHEALP